MRIVMISNFLPYPSFSGVRLRLASLLEWLTHSGHEISLLFLPGSRFEPKEIGQLDKLCKTVYVIDLRSFGLRFRHTIGLMGRRILSQFRLGRRYLRYRAFSQMQMGSSTILEPIDVGCSDSTLKKVARIIRGMPKKPDVTICQHLATSRLFELEELAGSLKILDTLDAIHKRMSMIEKGLRPQWACAAQEEANYLRRAEVIVAIQNEEAEIFRKLVPDRKVITVGQPFTAKRFSQKSCSTSCLLIGSVGIPNLEGLLWFQKFVWPLVLREIDSAQLLIAGAMSEYAFPEKSVQILGVVENLDEVYGQAAVVAVPILSGSGLKIKLVEALGKGRAVVATQHAALGVQDKEVFLSADEPILFARHIVTLLKDVELRRHFESKAFEFAKEHLQHEQVYSPLKILLQEYEESLAKRQPC